MFEKLFSPKDSENKPKPPQHKSCDDLVTHKDLVKLVQKIMATQVEIVAQLNNVLAVTRKTNAEITKQNADIVALQAAQDVLNAKVSELQALIETMGAEASPELVQVVSDLAVAAQANDDAIPDPITPPEVP